MKMYLILISAILLSSCTTVKCIKPSISNLTFTDSTFARASFRVMTTNSTDTTDNSERFESHFESEDAFADTLATTLVIALEEQFPNTTFSYAQEKNVIPISMANLEQLRDSSVLRFIRNVPEQYLLNLAFLEYAEERRKSIEYADNALGHRYGMEVNSSVPVLAFMVQIWNPKDGRKLLEFEVIEDRWDTIESMIQFATKHAIEYIRTGQTEVTDYGPIKN